MISLTGYSAGSYSSELIAGAGLPSDYYVANLALVSDEPGRDFVTPFIFASVDLCELAPWFRLIQCTQPSLHGYSRNFHLHNYLAASMVRWSYFLVVCYQKHFTADYAAMLDRYLVKHVFVACDPTTEVLSYLKGFRIAPILTAKTRQLLDRLLAAGMPGVLVDDLTPAQLNWEIEQRFSTPTKRITTAQERQLRSGRAPIELPPNAFVVSYPKEHLFGESELAPYPYSGLRLLLPNEALCNTLRHRHLPPKPRRPPDQSDNIKRLVAASRDAFAHKIADYLLIDPDSVSQIPT
jgi:hypothetical protein